MKFLCVECDEAMKLIRTSDSSDGSLNVIFKCPNCSREIAMLTNAMETQMVRAMDVKIGGREKAAEPMEKLRSSLAAPVSNANKQTYQNRKTEISEAKCPFPGMIDEMQNHQAAPVKEIFWTEGALQRIQKIPDFVREMVSKGIEKHAREQGYTEINEMVLDEVKGSFGM